MGRKLIVGVPFNRGLQTDVLPFNIDNNSFPNLVNAYQWRGRVKRKRGTTPLGRLRRFLDTTDGSGNLTVFISPVPIGSGLITVLIGTQIFVDPGGADPVMLLNNASPATAQLTRSTGELIIMGAAINTAVFYYPTLPVMGLEDLTLPGMQFPGTLAFDTKYSYNIQTVNPYGIYDVSFYKNPNLDAKLYLNYTPKSTPTPTSWNGQNYRQFWTVNYQGALWATNGVEVPFNGSSSTIGMQFAEQEDITYNSSTVTTITLTIKNCPLVKGDFVFFNEWLNNGNYDKTLNMQSGYVTAASGGNPNTVTITCDFAKLLTSKYSPGIVQYLTNRSDILTDCIRWYDGDPTNGSATAPAPGVSGNGWVNFQPPLSNLNTIISDLPAAQYYLVGCKMIWPFKDRLLFIGPVVQTSVGTPLYLPDTVVYSENGTPFYTASFSGPATTYPITTDINNTNGQVYSPIIVPDNQTALPLSFFSDFVGFGGWISAGVSSPINTLGPNEDILIMGFGKLQTRFVYTGNDILPFEFFIVNSELDSTSTFSSIILDKGIMTRGSKGFIITSQVESRRFDDAILDQNFQINVQNNGADQITAQRDFENEWIYFTYPSSQTNYGFPTQTLFFNYRDNSWAIFDESYTTYGQFRRQTGLTWATLPANLTWATWNTPWNSGSNQVLQPEIIAGNAQGYIVFRSSQTTSETPSLTIQNIVGNTVTSPNHCLNAEDYIMISGVQGSIGSFVNGKIFSVFNTAQNTFQINASSISGMYNGGGQITRMYVPFIQTKQFPMTWELARKTRIGWQNYLLTKTQNSQITLLIFLSQDSLNAYNDPSQQPNDSLIYSTILYTCPESTNLGLTAANTNLQMIVEQDSVNPINATSPQPQIWHRINTSLIGDTVQLGFTLSDAQMTTLDTNGNPVNQFSEIEIHGMILDLNPSSLLA